VITGIHGISLSSCSRRKEGTQANTDYITNGVRIQKIVFLARINKALLCLGVSHHGGFD
jgi:hypothetical protein